MRLLSVPLEANGAASIRRMQYHRAASDIGSSSKANQGEPFPLAVIPKKAIDAMRGRSVNNQICAVQHLCQRLVISLYVLGAAELMHEWYYLAPGVLQLDMLFQRQDLVLTPCVGTQRPADAVAGFNLVMIEKAQFGNAIASKFNGDGGAKRTSADQGNALTGQSANCGNTFANVPLSSAVDGDDLCGHLSIPSLVEVAERADIHPNDPAVPDFLFGKFGGVDECKKASTKTVTDRSGRAVFPQRCLAYLL